MTDSDKNKMDQQQKDQNRNQSADQAGMKNNPSDKDTKPAK